MFTVRIVIFLLILLACSSLHAQEISPAATASTNVAPATAPLAEPATAPDTPPPVVVAPTNVIPLPVPAITNIIPAVKPKTAVSVPSLMGTFGSAPGGKFSVSGRTLRLPAPEAIRRPDGDWRRNLDFGILQARGNSDTLRYSLGLDAVKDQENDLFRLRGKGSYGESDGVKDTENALAAFRYERRLTHKLYALGNIEWMSDTIADLNYRITGILSPGIRLIRSETSLLNVELGAGYIEENKNEYETGYAAGRAAATVEHVINAHVLVWCTGEYLPKLADPEVFFVNAEAGIAAFVTRELSLNVCYQERYDSAPVEGKTSSDTVFSTACSLSF